MNDNKSNHIISVDEKRFDSDNRSEDYQAYENLVKETIDYESLEITHHDDMRQVDETKYRELVWEWQSLKIWLNRWGND